MGDPSPQSEQSLLKQDQKSFDTTPVESVVNPLMFIRDISDNIAFMVTGSVRDTDATNSDKYGVIFIAPFPCAIVGGYYRHKTKSSGGGAVTIEVLKLSDGTALTSGTLMLANGFDATATNNTYQYARPATDISARQLARGEAVGIKPTGTPVSLNDVHVTLVFRTELKNLPL